jgi:hypothetical protein
MVTGGGPGGMVDEGLMAVTVQNEFGAPHCGAPILIYR